MKALDNYEVEGQLSIFETYSPDTWSGKTYQEPSQATEGKTFRQFSKRRSASSTKMPLFLNLRRGGGQSQDLSWETGIRSLGEFMTHNSGESPNEGNVSLLSQILEDSVPERFSLSQKACQGILNRAAKRGKALPEILKSALENQCRGNGAAGSGSV